MGKVLCQWRVTPYEALFIKAETSLVEEILVFWGKGDFSSLEMGVNAAVGISLRNTVEVGHRIEWELVGKVRVSSPEGAEESMMDGTDAIKALKPREIGLRGWCVDVNGTGEDELAHGGWYSSMVGG